ncbi:MAG: magnesium/cobalt transporter CorA [Bacteroidetes bacterium]|nr:magnesium/cobalt transporter CorA [Bacteroidota bacterium]
MARHRNRTERKKVSLPPGTLVYVGDAVEGPARLRSVTYDRDNVEMRVVTADALTKADSDVVTWLKIEGVHDVDTVQRVGELYGLHMLVLEDIVNTEHRTKCDEYDDAAFLILKHLRSDDGAELHEENIALVLKHNAVLSFSEHAQDVFEPNRERIEAANGRFRTRGADYLFYTLIDSVVDHYVATVDQFDDTIEQLEDEVLLDPTRDSVHRIHGLRRKLLHLRKAVLPLREAVMQLLRNEGGLISSDVGVFLRDVQDHLAQVLDGIEHNREVLGGLLELYMSHESNRMNEVMKVLTIIATVFIPLTFIAGVYGMNFEYMPELSQPWGYPGTIAIMLSMAVGMFLFFRKKKWL